MTSRERTFFAGLILGLVLYPAMFVTFADPDWWMVPCWFVGVWFGFLGLRWWMRPWR